MNEISRHQGAYGIFFRYEYQGKEKRVLDRMSATKEEGMIQCRDLIKLFFSEPQLMNGLEECHQEDPSQTRDPASIFRQMTTTSLDLANFSLTFTI